MQQELGVDICGCLRLTEHSLDIIRHQHEKGFVLVEIGDDMQRRVTQLVFLRQFCANGPIFLQGPCVLVLK
jgi:hypothetical protein